MTTLSDLSIPLTLYKQGVCYRKQAKPGAVSSGFYCVLDPDLRRDLCIDPVRVLATPGKPTAFWLRAILDSALARGQFTFETALPSHSAGGRDEVAIRSVFQLGGDVIVKINQPILARTDSPEILEAHRQWTSWCLVQLMQALALPPVVRRIGWICLVLGPLCFAAGGLWFGGAVQALGILLSMPGHLLLPSAKLRYLGWLPLVLATAMVAIPFAITTFPHIGLLQLGLVALFQGGVWRPAGGQGVSWLAKKVLGCLIRRKIHVGAQGYLNFRSRWRVG
jgi:hypothetical protein